MIWYCSISSVIAAFTLFLPWWQHIIVNIIIIVMSQCNLSSLLKTDQAARIEPSLISNNNDIFSWHWLEHKNKEKICLNWPLKSHKTLNTFLCDRNIALCFIDLSYYLNIKHHHNFCVFGVFEWYIFFNFLCLKCMHTTDPFLGYFPLEKLGFKPQKDWKADKLGV